jgi:hypothetical protein
MLCDWVPRVFGRARAKVAALRQGPQVRFDAGEENTKLAASLLCAIRGSDAAALIAATPAACDIPRASSLLSSLAAERRPGSSS